MKIHSLLSAIVTRFRKTKNFSKDNTFGIEEMENIMEDMASAKSGYVAIIGKAKCRQINNDE